MEANLHVAVTVLPAVIAATLAADALRLRRRPAGMAIAMLLATAAIWTGAYAGELAASSLEAKLLWAKLQYVGIALIPVAWLLFADSYTGNRWRLQSRWPLLLPVPMITLALAWTNEMHGRVWASVGIEQFGDITVLGLEHGPWFFAHVAFCYLLLAAGSARLLLELRRQPIFNRQAYALVLGALAPWIGNFLYLSGLNPLAPLDLTPFAFVGSAVILTFAVDRLGLFDLRPVAHAAILASMRDGVLVLDSRNRVVEANPAALRMLADGADPIGRDVREFINAIPENLGRHDGELRLDFAHTTDQRITYYSLSSSPLTEATAVDGGRILVVSDVTDQRVAEEHIHLLANQDALTGLPNREVFHSRFERALRAAARNGANAACLFLDLDNFKRINDHYGHSVGDEVLREVVSRIEKGLRANDTVMTVGSDEPTLARFGGDEFVILLEGLDRPEDAVPPAERIVRELQAPYRQGEAILSLNGSVGVAIYPDDGADAETLLRNADAAMYAAKGAGGNRVQFFTERIREAVAHRITVESELHRAIEDDSFVLMYQPQVSIRTGRVVGLEALLRWDHPERGLIRPSDFVAVAEESGLIVPLSEWTLRRACSDWAALTAETGAECRVSINLSPRQFAEARLIDDMRAVLAETNMDASWLEIELTEGALMVDAEATQLLLEQLKQLGVSLAIDDFGAGYSSLAYLRSFPLDLIKIDQSFTAGMLDDERCANLVRAMIAMAHNLGLEVVCEGVEKPDQLDLLRVAGCDRVQGYLLGRPMSIEAAIDLMRDQPSRRLAATA